MESDIHVRLALKQTDSKLLRAIEEAIVALTRVYTVSMDCEEESLTALDAVPWTESASNARNVR